MIGSAIDMLPGLITVVLATNHLQKAINDPNWETWLVFLALVGLEPRKTLHPKNTFLFHP